MPAGTYVESAKVFQNVQYFDDDGVEYFIKILTKLNLGNLPAATQGKTQFEGKYRHLRIAATDTNGHVHHKEIPFSRTGLATILTGFNPTIDGLNNYVAHGWVGEVTRA